MTEHLSSHHSLPNRVLLDFFRGVRVQGLVGDESNHQTRHKSPDQPVGEFVCNSQVQPVEGGHYAHL